MASQRLVHVVTFILSAYLRLVAKTSRISIQHKEHFQNNIMLGFWHGDSCTMQLLLGQLAKQFTGIKVIVTADTRGNYIDGMLKHYGAEAVRLPDGLNMRHFLQELQGMGQMEKGIFACALDGPTGPVHQPKKLLFKLAQSAQKEMVCVSYHYSRVLRLRKRWDKYAIPLPFTRITVKSEWLGMISQMHLRQFPEHFSSQLNQL